MGNNEHKNALQIVLTTLSSVSTNSMVVSSLSMITVMWFGSSICPKIYKIKVLT